MVGLSWPYRLIIRAATWPAGSFIAQMAVVASVWLAPENSGLAGFYLFTAPWIAPVLLVLNVPLVLAASRGWRMSTRAKRNHALEHATIHFMKSVAPSLRLGGRALENGFRISGAPSESAIAHAFREIQIALLRGQPLAAVSPRCGSLVVTGLAWAALVVLATIITLCLLSPGPTAAFVMILVATFVFAVSKPRVGRWAQQRFFLAAPPAGTEIAAIQKVRAEGWERPPVFQVRTRFDDRDSA